MAGFHNTFGFRNTPRQKRDFQDSAEVKAGVDPQGQNGVGQYIFAQNMSGVTLLTGCCTCAGKLLYSGAAEGTGTIGGCACANEFAGRYDSCGCQQENPCCRNSTIHVSNKSRINREVLNTFQCKFIPLGAGCSCGPDGGRLTCNNLYMALGYIPACCMGLFQRVA